MRWYERIPGRAYALVAGALIATQAAVLYAMGRVPICKCGYVRLWQGVVRSPENSQQISDWYSFSHLIHGFIFYWFLKKVAPRWPVGLRIIGAMAFEVCWEILENSPLIINRYRTATIALDYYGDSILNSISDVGFCTLGFLLARRLPVAASVCLIIGLELFTLYFIRDNLTLNIIMLAWPIDAIRKWQAVAIG
jgi:hypothetical protein